MVTLARMRWWHVEQAVRLETSLFPDPWGARTFWSELGQLDTRHYVVGLDGERVVGWAGLCDYPDEAWVQTIAVTEQARGTGLSDRLLQDLLEEAARRGQRSVSLEVRADNAPAQRLYDRHGFTRGAVRRGYYPGGVDALILTRRLPRVGA